MSRRFALTRNALRGLGRDLDLFASGDAERLRRMFLFSLEQRDGSLA
jgi:hypothetical protein